MKDITQEKLEESRVRHRRTRQFLTGLVVLSAVTVCAVFWQLHQTGISATSDAICGIEEHTHSEACFEERYLCGMEEGQPEYTGHVHGPECYEETSHLLYAEEVHTHDESCYQEESHLTCQQEPHAHAKDCYEEDGSLTCTLEAHTHTEDCYTAENTLICTRQIHEHTDDCWEQETVLICTEETQEPVAHAHTDACRESVLVCTLPEHTHSESCLVDLNADVETAEQWQENAGCPGTGIWSSDLAAVAAAQLGYTESSRNFTVDADGVRHGYTRYGAAYGDPYGPWDGMFLAYCLRYGGVPEYVAPQRAGISAMLAECAGSAWLWQGSAEDAQPGDIVFFDGTGGIVCDGGETLRVICGDVSGTVAVQSVAAQSVHHWIDVTDACKTYTASADAAEPTQEQTESADPTETPDAGQGDNEEGSEDGESSLLPPAASAETEEGKKLPKTEEQESNEQTDDADPIDLTVNNRILLEKLGVARGDGTYQDIAPGTVVTEGASIRFYFEYSFSSEGNSSMQAVYSPIPQGFHAAMAAAGDIYNRNNVKTGTYAIEGDTLRFSYTEGIWNSKGSIQGGFYLYGTVGRTGTDDQQDLEFPGFGNLVVKKLDMDLTVQKKYGKITADGEGNCYYENVITCSSASGTEGNPITLKDSLNDPGNQSGFEILRGIYDEDVDIRITKNGQSYSLQPGQYALNQDDPENPYFVLEELPALEAGEKYEIRYRVKIPPKSFDSITGWSRLYNTARGYVDGALLGQSTAYSTFPANMELKKNWSYDSTTGRIAWTISVRNPLGGNAYALAGYKISDPGIQGLDVIGDITLYGGEVKAGRELAAISPADFLQNGYTFPASLPTYQYYYFRFETEVPAGDGNLSIPNTVYMDRGNQHLQAGTTAVIAADQWGLAKRSQGAIVNGTAYWTISAVNSTGASEFTLRDEILNAVEGGSEFPDSHYALASELQYCLTHNGLQLLMVDGTTQNYQALDEVHYYDGDGNSVSADDTATHVRSFEFVFRSQGVPVKAITFTGYPTHAETSQVGLGHTYTYVNRAQINNSGFSSDNTTYHNTGVLDKMVSTDGVTFGKDVTVNYPSRANGSVTVTYRVELHTSEGESGELRVQDQLPTGCGFQPGSVRLFVEDVSTSDGAPGTISTDYDAQAHTVTFRIAGYNPDGTAHKLSVLYSVTICPSTDARWNDLSLGSMEYKNTITWGEHTSSAKATMQREVKVLDKRVEPKADQQVQYTVYINLENKFFCDAASGQIQEYLVLEDKLDLPPNVTLSDLNAVLLSDTIKLYYYDYDSTSNQVHYSVEVPRQLYKIEKDPSCFLKLSVPNGTAMVLQYTCSMQTTIQDLQITNSISLVGQNYKATSNQYSVQNSVAVAFSTELSLHKVDSFSRFPLADAVFEIERYDKDKNAWVHHLYPEEEADNTGVFRIGISVIDDGKSLQPDTLYRILEKKAPSGYKLDKNPRYVLFYSSSFDDGLLKAAGMTKTQAEGKLGEATVRRDEITGSGSHDALDMDIENQPEKLTIQKLWLDPNNRPFDTAPIDEPITVQLKRRTDQPQDPVVRTIQLGPDNDWAASFDLGDGENRLPAVDGTGNPCLYYVEEQALQPNWKVSYTNNGGIQTGTIVIQNRVYAYELPKTGGVGTGRLYGLGLCLACVSIGGLLYTHQKRRNEK